MFWNKNKFSMRQISGRTFASEAVCKSSMVALAIVQDVQSIYQASPQDWTFEIVDSRHIRATCRTNEGILYNEVLCRDMHGRNDADHLFVMKAARVYIMLSEEYPDFLSSDYWKKDEGVLK
jgi:hypothetical protein